MFRLTLPTPQALVVTTKNRYPELQKLGLHAIPPGQHDYAIVANTIPSKIGKESSDADLSVLPSGIADSSTGSGTSVSFQDMACGACDRSDSPAGMRQTMTTNGVWELPFGPSGLASRILGGWSLSGLATARRILRPASV